MSLQDKLMTDLQQAMRDKDELRRSVLRMLRSSVKNAEIAKRGPLTEEETLAVLQKEAKQRRESAQEFHKARRDDLADSERAELGIIESYLPQQLPPEEIRGIVRSVIADTGAASVNDLGKVMPAVMSKVKGLADGRLVNQIVREELGNAS